MKLVVDEIKKKPKFAIVIGENDMWTTNPDLARQLLNPEDGFKHSQGSNFRVDWKCMECDKIHFNKVIKRVKNEGLNCDICSHTVKFPERVMIAVLSQLDIEFIHDKPFKWSNHKRYDFYLPDYNTIIETHGGQHYDRGFEGIGGNTLEEEQKNR